ncbi:MAG: Omp28-related outer membrane protein [Vicingaceae bacterium]
MKFMRAFLLIAVIITSILLGCEPEDEEMIQSNSSSTTQLDSTNQDTTTVDTTVVDTTGQDTTIIDTTHQDTTVINPTDSVVYVIDSTFNFSNQDDINSFISNNTWIEKNAPLNNNSRFILLEEFTGHTNVFSPIGSQEAVRLDSIYGEQLIPVSIHAGPFARPQASPSGKYTTDFRVEGGHGEVFLNTFNVNSYPSGLVNRKNKQAVSSSNWTQLVSDYANDNPIVSLDLTTFYSANVNTVRAQVDIEWLSSTVSSQHNLSVFLVEDHILDWQKSGTQDIEFYNHRNVLRKVVDRTFGKPLKSPNVGDKESIQFITTVKPNWNASNLKVVAFIFDDNPSTYEVIQANSSHIK